MPIIAYDLAWWQWLTFALVCWFVSVALATLADESNRRQYITLKISFWLGVIAGTVCAAVGITLAIIDAPYIEWWQWLICAPVFWFASVGFVMIADKFERDEHIAATVSAWLSVLAGLDCVVFGVIRLIKHVRAS